MRKLLLSLIFITGTITMVNAKSEINNLSDTIMSPECFDFADYVVAQCGFTFASMEQEHAFWEAQYDFCESKTNYDEFQFE